MLCDYTRNYIAALFIPYDNLIVYLWYMYMCNYSKYQQLKISTIITIQQLTLVDSYTIENFHITQTFIKYNFHFLLLALIK